MAGRPARTAHGRPRLDRQAERGRPPAPARTADRHRRPGRLLRPGLRRPRPPTPQARPLPRQRGRRHRPGRRRPQGLRLPDPAPPGHGRRPPGPARGRPLPRRPAHRGRVRRQPRRTPGGRHQRLPPGHQPPGRQPARRHRALLGPVLLQPPPGREDRAAPVPARLEGPRRHDGPDQPAVRRVRLQRAEGQAEGPPAGGAAAPRGLADPGLINPQGRGDPYGAPPRGRGQPRCDRGRPPRPGPPLSGRCPRTPRCPGADAAPARRTGRKAAPAAPSASARGCAPTTRPYGRT